MVFEPVFLVVAVANMVEQKTVKKKQVVQAPEAKQLDHVLIPQVELVSDDELAGFFKKFSLSKDKLPLIKSEDPAVAFMHLNPGQVVKFMRTSLVTGQKVPYYRLVIS